MDKFGFAGFFRSHALGFFIPATDVFEDEDFSALQVFDCCFGFVAKEVIDIFYWTLENFAEDFCVFF